MFRTIAGLLRAALLPLVLLTAWEILLRGSNYAGYTSGKFIVLPPPSVVVLRLGELLTTRDFVTDVFQTLLTSMLGMSLGVVGALLLGIVVGGKKWGALYLEPTLHLLRTLPVITYVPIALVILGSDMRTPIFLAGFVTALYGTPSISVAVANFDQEKILFLRFRDVSNFRIAFGFILPEIFAALSASLSIIVTLSVAICVVAEMLFPSLGGIGAWLLRTKEVSDYSGLWACTLALATAGFLLHSSMLTLWQFAIPWAKTKKERAYL